MGKIRAITEFPTRMEGAAALGALQAKAITVWLDESKTLIVSATDGHLVWIHDIGNRHNWIIAFADFTEKFGRSES